MNGIRNEKNPLRKLAFCIILLALSIISVVGCTQDKPSEIASPTISPTKQPTLASPTIVAITTSRPEAAVTPNQEVVIPTVTPFVLPTISPTPTSTPNTQALGITFNVYTTTSGLPNLQINKIQIDNQGQVWAGTGSGLAVFHDGQWDTVSGTEEWRVNAFWVHNEQIWSTCPNWLCFFDGTSWSSIAPYPPLVAGDTVNQIQSIFVDSSEGVWVGTFFSGLGYWKDSTWTVHQVTNGLPSDIVTAIGEDSQGNIWIVASGQGAGGPVQGYGLSGVARFDGTSWYQIPNTPRIDRYRGIGGDLWITNNDQIIMVNGSDGGVFFLSGNQWIGQYVEQIPNSPYAEYSAYTMSVAVGNDSTWVSLGCSFGCPDGSGNRFGGLMRIIDGEWLDYSSVESLKAFNTMDIAVAQDGTLYVATFGGGVIEIKNID